MNVVVTRKYKGVKDEKGAVSSVYNYNKSVSGGAGTSTTVINNYYTTVAPEATLTAPTFMLCLNFLDLMSFKYVCLEDMIITSQTSENGDATLSVALDSLVGQFAVLTITPTVLGMVMLKGEYKL